MDEPRTEDRLLEQLAAHLREQNDDVSDRDEPIDPAMRERLFEMMQSSRGSTPTIVRSRKAANRTWWMLVPSFSAAAAVALVMWWPPTEPTTEPPIEPPPRADLSNYDLEHDGGMATQRSDEPPAGRVPQYRAGTPFTWTMVPEAEVVDQVSLRMCASPKASGPEVEIEVGELLDPESTSSLRVKGRAGQLGLQPGAWTIVLAAGYRDALAEVESICQVSESETIQTAKLEVEMLPD